MSSVIIELLINPKPQKGPKVEMRISYFQDKEIPEKELPDVGDMAAFLASASAAVRSVGHFQVFSIIINIIVSLCIR